MENNNGFIVGRETLSSFTAKTFGWMFFGLLVTFIFAYTCYMTGLIFYVLSIPYMNFVLLIGELALVIYLSSRIDKLSVGAARGLFFAYALVNGLTFSVYFLLYQIPTLIYIFAVTSVYFGAMALFGYITKIDLSRLGPVLMFGAGGLLIFWVLAMFINLTAFETVACSIGIVIFLLFTAYDTQKMRAMYAYYAADDEMLQKASIFSALSLYLDFINLFIYILRIFGKRR